MKKISFILAIAVILTTISIPALYVSADDVFYSDFESFNSPTASATPSDWTRREGWGNGVYSYATGDYHGTALQIFTDRASQTANLTNWYTKLEKDINQTIDTSKKYVYSFDVYIPEIIDAADAHYFQSYVTTTADILDSDTDDSTIPLFGWRLISIANSGLQFRTYAGNGNTNGKWWFSEKLGEVEAQGTVKTLAGGNWYHLDAIYDASTSRTAVDYAAVNYYIDGEWVDWGPAALTKGDIGKVHMDYYVNSKDADGNTPTKDKHGIIVDNVRITTADEYTAYSTKIIAADEGTSELYIPFDSVVSVQELQNASISIEKFAFDDVAMKDGLPATDVQLTGMYANGLDVTFTEPLTAGGTQYRIAISGIKDIFGNDFKVLYDIAVYPADVDAVETRVFNEEFENYTTGIPQGWGGWRFNLTNSNWYSEIKVTGKTIDNDKGIAVNQNTTTTDHLAAIKKAVDLPYDENVLSYTLKYNMHIPNFVTSTTAQDGTTKVSQVIQIQLSDDSDGTKPTIGFKGFTDGNGMKINYYNVNSSDQYANTEAKKNGETFRLTEGGDYTFKAVCNLVDKKVTYYINDDVVGEVTGITLADSNFKNVSFGGNNKNVNVDNADTDYNCYVKSIEIYQEKKPATVKAIKFTDNGNIVPMAEIIGKNQMSIYFIGSDPELSDGDVVLKKGSEIITHTGTYDAATKVYTMTLDKNLAYVSNYTLTIDKLGFSTEFETLSGYEITDLAVNGEIADGSLTVSGKIRNVANPDGSATVMLVMYDENGYLDMYTKTISVAVGKTADIETENIIPTAGTKRVKCFVWSTLSDMVPLVSAVSK